MRIPSREALLSELDSRPYGARLEHVARLGRDARGDPGLAPLLRRLLAGDAYEGELALEMAQAAHDEDAVRLGLVHASTRVQGRASALAGRLEDAEALEQLLPRLAPFVRRRVLKGLVLARREALVTRLLPLVLARYGEGEAALLLPALEPSELRRRLPALAHRLHSWRQLVHRAPDTVLAFLQQSLAAASEQERLSFFSRYDTAFQELTPLRDEAVLTLARDYSPPGSLPWYVTKFLPSLLRRRPEATLALLLRPAYRSTLLGQRWPGMGALRESRFLSDEQRRTFARVLAEAPLQLAQFLGALPPSERPALFAHAYEGTAPRVHPEPLLAVLPHTLRDAEAARQLEVREVREDRDRQLTTVALRTIEHAREPLRQAATASKAEERAQALRLLVSCTGRSRRGLAETLATLTRLKNEQDPVRRTVLQELARLPLSLFTPEHIPALETLVTYVVEARDTSVGTQHAFQELAFRLLRQYAATTEHPLFRFALDTLQWLAAQSGALRLPRLEDLPPGTEHHLFAALLPLIRAAHQRESTELTFTVARALGRRAWNVDLLQALLAPLTEATPDTAAQTAIGLWLAPPRTRDARVRALLDRDPSHIVLPEVFAHLHHRRQDWLDPFLQGRPLKGRFATGKTGWVPHPSWGGFQRWLPRQQEQLRERLLAMVRDTGRNDMERASLLRGLPNLPVTQVDTLAPFLAAQGVPIVEAALGALAALDQPAPALPLLLDFIDGDRARVAMYAVLQLALRLPPEAMVAPLGTLLAREKLKVTVHKEALRLLGALRLPNALPLLRAQWDNPRLHRDVRIAVGHAARQLLDSPAAWELLEELARHPDADIASSLLDTWPSQLSTEARPRYAALLLQVAHHANPHVRRRAFSLFYLWTPGMEDAVAREAAARVLDISGGVEWREAIGALMAVTREGKAVEHLRDCVARLVCAPRSFDATAERDVPEHQRLKALLQALLQLPPPVRVRVRTSLEAVARELGREPSLWPESAALRVAGLDWRALPDVSRTLRALAEETREEPLFVPLLTHAVAAPLQDPGAEWTPEGLLELAREVEDVLPLVSVALVAAAGRKLHWREDAAQALRGLRQHPRPAVRAAALACLTATE